MTFAAVFILAFVSPASGEDPPRPNILWITSEDNGPHLGCYGDTFADTPNLDKLAGRGLVYLNCRWRSCITDSAKNSAGFGALLFLLTLYLAIWFIDQFTFRPALFFCVCYLLCTYSFFINLPIAITLLSAVNL